MTKDLATEIPTMAELEPLVKRADEGDRSVLPELRRAMERHPTPWKATKTYRDLAVEALVMVIDKRGTQEALRHQVKAVQAEVAGPDPAPLEELLAEQIAMNWLALMHLQAEYSATTYQGGNWTEEKDKRLDRAHRRYLRAIESLARVRRLLGPHIHMNMTQIAYLAGTDQPAPRAAAGGPGERMNNDGEYRAGDCRHDARCRNPDRGRADG